MTRRPGSCCLAFIVIVCGACEGQRLPPTSPPPPPPPNIVAVRVEGRVIDGEREEPVAGALITVRSVTSDGRTRSVSDASATADNKERLISRRTCRRTGRGWYWTSVEMITSVL